MIDRLRQSVARQLGPRAWTGLWVGTVLILAGATALGAWLLRPDYQVLFADLTAQDMSAMAAELDRQKLPYRLEPGEQGGGTLLVEAQDVLRTRMKLMGRELPLHGAVGFELFNGGDIGMTEFTQKINYQRALQGELTRTILSLAEVRDARVLLALPEQGLFKQAASKAKASVTLTLRNGAALRPQQIAGIQRLVAAAVPGIATADVTLVDQAGVALTRSPGEGDTESGGGRLDLQKETEAYLARKATAVLEHALGAGQALASVDVSLDLDRIQSSTEEIIGAPARPGGAATGVVLRERETSRDTAPPLAAAGSDPAASGGSSQREVEYAVGRRVEQVVRQPGSIRRLQVAVVVRQPLTEVQAGHLRQIVAASTGANTERGDTVVVQTLAAFAAEAPAAAPATGPISAPVAEAAAPPRRDPALPPYGLRLLVAAIALIAALLLWLGLRRPQAQPAEPAAMTPEQRQAALEQLRGWLRQGPAPGTASAHAEGAP
ncbi:flagellar M-ring protein FliF [Xylophilus rhododendri]|uniref:Flagellar M-ring protein n=1 Tax=Xylophilus rhododendri TaxID=2697032 RepID=A0A857J624_9BURK|nr:flagellar basal-body MS-ring/collar protein FliF [Xylophilus rhododendri]QHI99167.1 flagellar M-ring protein FliF [Xylophilus rhododendri]